MALKREFTFKANLLLPSLVFSTISEQRFTGRAFADFCRNPTRMGWAAAAFLLVLLAAFVFDRFDPSRSLAAFAGRARQLRSN
jgi:hypothetical protein